MMVPTVSILMPIHNERSHILQCFSAIIHQEYPPELLEILVADGMSTDGTRDIIKNYQVDCPNLKIIDNPPGIVSTGLNQAVRNSHGEIIIRVDGHTVIAPDYVRQCVDALQRSGADNVGGRMDAVGQGAFAQGVAIATSSPFGVGGARFHYSDQEEWVDTVYMGAWPREVFERIGLFDEELVRDQDDEFNYRLREHGGKILLNPSIQSQYYVRSTPITLWKQYFQYGYWKVRVLQKHPRQMRLRQFIPPIFVASLIISALISVFNPIGVYILIAIVALYLLTNLTASILTSAKSGWHHLPLLPVCYSILHLSYGLGFLIGLVRFANRWGDKVGKTPAL